MWPRTTAAGSPSTAPLERDPPSPCICLEPRALCFAEYGIRYRHAPAFGLPLSALRFCYWPIASSQMRARGLQEVEVALQRGDAPAVERVAHKLKGGSGSNGARGMSGL